LCLGCVLQGYRAEQQVRETFRAAFARHAEVPACRVTSHDIVLQQQGKALQATSELTVRNPNGRDLPRFLLYLNPGLKVKRLEAAGQPLDFRREAQVIVVERPLRAGDSLRLKMHYEGTLDERLGYLDAEQASYEDTRRGNVFFHFGRRYAIVEQSALVLPPGLLWYPVAVPPENPSRPFFSERDYTCFRLCVAQPIQPVLISQGRAERRGDTLFFEQTYPLEGLSLCGGDYEQQSFHLGKIEVEWYHFKGNDCVSLFLEGVNKNELVKKMEEDILKKRRIYSGQLTDVMKRYDWFDGQDGCLRLVETPLAFNAPFRAWKNRSERIQPGMVFFGEGGIGAFSRVLSYPAFLRDRESKYGPSVRFVGNFLMEKDVVSSYHPFLRALKLYEANTGEENHYFPYNFNTLFFEPEACVVSARYEGIDRVLKLMMELERISGGLDLSETMVKAFMYLREHTLNEALRDRTISFDLQKQILAIKMQELESQLMEFASQRDLVDFLTAFYRTHRGEVPLDTLCKAMRKELNVDFEAVLRDWEVKRGASFQVEDFRFGRMKGQPYQVAAFKIRNVGEKAGRISGDFGYGGSYSLMLQPGECKEVRWTGNTNTFLLNLGASRNIPADMHYVDNRSQGDVMDTLTGVFDIPASVFDLSEGEIVVDNEDPGFRLIVPPSRKLYRCFFEEKPYSEIYRGISRRMKRWGKVYNFNYYGKEIRSVYVKTAATGQYKAEWSAELPEEGTYEILVMHPNARFATGVVELFYTVSGAGKESQEVSRDFERGEWVSLGEFHFQRGESTVVLSDRAVDKRKEQERRFGPPYIVADAVKWRRVK